MIRNIFLSLVSNLVLTFFILMLATGVASLDPSLPFHQIATWEITLQVLLSIITLTLFILVGRFLLHDTGSLWKNIVSVTPPFLIGLYVTINVASTPHQMNLSALYYTGYSTPFVFSLSTSQLSIAPYENSLPYGLVFSLLPSILYVFGLQWKSLVRKSVLDS